MSLNCPLPMPEFPPPKNLTASPIFRAALRNLTAALAFYDALDSRTTPNISYSLQVFSTNPGPSILWERFHTQANLAEVRVTGVTEVDANSVYRLGSLTKVYTVLAFLAEVGDRHFTDPVTRWVPELAEVLRQRDGRANAVDDMDWEDVTLGALAGQISGIIRDYGVLGEVTQVMPPAWYQAIGFPRLEPDQLPPCGAIRLCNRTEFFSGFTKLPPSFKPSYTPAYSNIAYQLLAYALEAIAGKPFFQILFERIILPLNLTRTYYGLANESHGIIPGTLEETLWYAYLGDASPRWFKPMAFSSDMLAAVSAPWGLRRIRLDDANPHRSITGYQKAGRLQKYTSIFILLPEWSLGFTILAAGEIDGATAFNFADLLGDYIIPAFDAVAREDAHDTYSGTYRSREGLNSSLTITTEPAKPGMGIGPWLSNGVDMVDHGLRLQGGVNKPGFAPAVRLYWAGLESAAADGTKRQAFKAIFEDEAFPPLERPRRFATDCASWLPITGTTHGSLPLDEFVFHLDGEGKVVSVENLALRAMLYKEAERR